MTFKLVLLVCLLVTAHARIHVGLREPFDVQIKEQRYLGFRVPVSGRIVGGKNAEPDEFPHQISLQYGHPPRIGHICGGSVLNNYWILTAAHCSLVISNLYVKVGKYMLNETDKHEQFSKVAKVFYHTEYRVGPNPYDIALLKLEKPLVFNGHVQPISLPEAHSEVDGEVVLSGWGSISSTGSKKPDILQKATLPIMDNETCKKVMEKMIGPCIILPSNLCTGSLTGRVTSCNGDSGGPLIKYKKDGKTEIVGIISWGVDPCGEYGAPSVYTRVSSYIDWIENIMINN